MFRTTITQNVKGFYDLIIYNEHAGRVEFQAEDIPTEKRAQDQVMRWTLGHIGTPLAVDKGGLTEGLMGDLLNYRSRMGGSSCQ